MKEAYDQCCAVLSIGLAGAHGEMTNGGMITYYSTNLKAYYGEVVEGGYVIDKSGPLDRKPGLAVMSPMCQGNLKPGERDAFDVAPEDNFLAQVFANEPTSGYCGLSRLMLAAPKCGAMDFVAPDVYASWWASHGAKVGQRVGDEIVWADGTREAIPPFADRYKD